MAESDNPLRPHNDDTSSNVIIVVTTISVPSFVVLSIVCGVTGFMVIASKLRSSKHETTADEVPRPSWTNTTVVPAPLYESVFPMEFQEQDLQLKENAAYGTLSSSLIHGNYTAAIDPVYSNVT